MDEPGIFKLGYVFFTELQTLHISALLSLFVLLLLTLGIFSIFPQILVQTRR